MLGIPLGILIGVITGVAAALLIDMASGQGRKDSGTLLKLLAQLLAIPTFWFGGPWLATTMIKQLDLNSILPTYLTALACTFVGIMLTRIWRLVAGAGNVIGAKGGAGK